MNTRIEAIGKESVLNAKEIILQGGLVGMPTETVYGLAADGLNGEAVEKIFQVKGRPSDNPLIAHVHKDFDIKKLVFINHNYVYKLLKLFTPGPLTLVFQSKNVVCSQAVCGGDTLAVRIPSHQGCQEFLRAVDRPIVAPSANLSKHTSPVTAQYVYNDLNGKIPLILDGGKCSGGIESTVLDVTGETPRILRAGLITREMMIDAVGSCIVAEHKEGDKVKSPGVKYSHYKPTCQTALYGYGEIELVKERYEQELKLGKTPYIMCPGELATKFENKNLLNLGIGEREIAFNLYDRLLEGEKKADIIIAVEMPNEKGIYAGIMNRLRKSCG